MSDHNPDPPVLPDNWAQVLWERQAEQQQIQAEQRQIQAEQQQVFAQMTPQLTLLLQSVSPVQPVPAAQPVPVPVSASVPATTDQIPRGAKLNPPKPFSGRVASDAKQFVSQCDLVFLTDPLPYQSHSVRVNYAISFLEGAAFCWVEPYLDPDTPRPDWMTTWPTFKSRLLQDFGYYGQVIVSRQALASLRQTTSVTDYAIAFRRHHSFLNVDEDSKRYAFFTRPHQTFPASTFVCASPGADRLPRSRRRHSFHRL